MRCGHRVNLLRLTWSSFEESRDDRPLPGYDTPPHVTSSYTTSLDATLLNFASGYRALISCYVLG
ncbi:hypothetical protein BI295_25630 [Mycobacterium avium subsp. hominissuis]|nr:hypothetical protein BI295_25630 [Mycobacterium avium subsp. hominissuis]